MTIVIMTASGRSNGSSEWDDIYRSKQTQRRQEVAKLNGLYFAIPDLMDRFRSSRFMIDVLNKNFLASTADLDIVNFVEMDDDEFLDEIEKFLLRAVPLDKEVVTPILERNPVDEIRSLFKNAFTEDYSEWDLLEEALRLEGADVHFASTVLFLATQGRCIMYHDHLYHALSQLYPGEFDAEFEIPTDPLSYYRILFYCYALTETYEFRSMSELYHFLWYGHHTNWEFD